MKRLIPTYIQAMSLDKHKLINKLDSWSEEITEHVAKCVMYGTTLGESKYNHWIEHEIATWICDANDFTCKHNNKKLKPRDYEDHLFGYLGDSIAEARANLHGLQLHNKKFYESYPYIEVDDDMIRKMFDASQQILAQFVPILSSKNSLTKDDIQSILHNILDPICKDGNFLTY